MKVHGFKPDSKWSLRAGGPWKSSLKGPKRPFD